jgi:phosphate starvation-inducible PhoH-like protein
MNIYGLFLMFVYLTNTETFKTLVSNNNPSKLFMKKKTPLSYLYKPKSVNQNQYSEYLNDECIKIIISIGPAGTGKTLFACQKAITQMKCQEIDKIVITRPIVTIEEDIGFLPGNIIKKMDPWTKPIFDIFLEYYSKSELDLLLFNGKIEICPLVFMRGRTFKNSFIIADEMQNSSPNQMKMLTTRLGLNSRLVITGDLNQTDILKENGLDDFINKVKAYKKSNLIKFITFNNEDIERSDIVKEVINLYSNKKPFDLIKNNSIIKNNDSALIPKHHITNNYDIYFGPTDFY